MGQRIQYTMKKPAKIWTSAHQGTMSGLPIQVICAQSKVKTLMPRPAETPKSWLTTMSFGLIQQTNEKMDRAVKMYPI